MEVEYHARVLEGVNSVKSVPGYAFDFRNICIQGEMTFGDPFEDSGVVEGEGAWEKREESAVATPASLRICPPETEREFFVDKLLVRIHFVIMMIRWTGLAPLESKFTFPGSLTSTFLVRFLSSLSAALQRRTMPPLSSPRPPRSTNQVIREHLAHKKPPPPIGPP